jgi:hypothetical protein
VAEEKVRRGGEKENEHRIASREIGIRRRKTNKNIKRYHMQTQENKTEAGKRKVYQAPFVEKIKVDTDFTYFTSSQSNTPPPENPGQNSIIFNPLKFLK